MRPLSYYVLEIARDLFYFVFQDFNQRKADRTAALSQSPEAKALLGQLPIDVKGPCIKHPAITEIALYVSCTALVCFALAVSFPLSLSCQGACARRRAKDNSYTPEERVQLRSPLRPRGSYPNEAILSSAREVSASAGKKVDVHIEVSPSEGEVNEASNSNATSEVNSKAEEEKKEKMSKF